jgi:hypothetical protein
MPGLRAARQRKRDEIESDQCGLSPLAFPRDIDGITAWTARLFKRGLIGQSNYLWDRLLKNLLSGVYIGRRNLQTDASKQVGHLPVQSDKVLVFEKTEDTCGFDNAAGNDRLR